MPSTTEAFKRSANYWLNLIEKSPRPLEDTRVNRPHIEAAWAWVKKSEDEELIQRYEAAFPEITLI